MIKHKRNEIKKQVEIPVEQIKYDPVKVKERLNKIKKKIYLFCGRRSDRIKVLLHEREGFVLLYKRLDANVGKYRWPRNRNEVKPITWRQFDWLMSGLEIEQPKAIKSTGNA